MNYFKIYTLNRNDNIICKNKDYFKYTLFYEL